MATEQIDPEETAIVALIHSIKEMAAERDVLVKRIPPPNPFYNREYATTISGGVCTTSIRAPGGKITSRDAAYLIRWFELIIEQLKDDLEPEAHQ